MPADMSRMLSYCDENKTKWAEHVETDHEKLVYEKHEDPNASDSLSDGDVEELKDKVNGTLSAKK